MGESQEIIEQFLLEASAKLVEEQDLYPIYPPALVRMLSVLNKTGKLPPRKT